MERKEKEMSLGCDYDINEGVYFTPDELRQGQVVFVGDRVWEFGRVESIWADWAVIRVDNHGPWLLRAGDTVEGTILLGT